MNYLKLSSKKYDGLERIVDRTKVDEFINSLPFKLTLDQEKAVNAIYDDLTSPNRMSSRVVLIVLVMTCMVRAILLFFLFL